MNVVGDTWRAAGRQFRLSGAVFFVVEVDREGGCERVVYCVGKAAVDYVGVLIGIRTGEREL